MFIGFSNVVDGNENYDMERKCLYLYAFYISEKKRKVWWIMIVLPMW